MFSCVLGTREHMYKKYVINTECPPKKLTQEKRSPLSQPVNDYDNEFDFADNVANTYQIYSKNC